MNSKQNELQPPAQAGESREAGRVAGEPSGGESRETDWPEASPVGECAAREREASTRSPS